MIIGSHKRMMTYKKTGFKCAICGSTHELECVCFIPEWTRIVSDDYENLIPLCFKCYLERGYNFIELGKLKFLPDTYIQMLMRYYSDIAMYLYKYVRMYGSYRTRGKLDIDRAKLILQSYDLYIEEHSKDLKWEEIK